jgi:hypothetical protein
MNRFTAWFISLDTIRVAVLYIKIKGNWKVEPVKEHSMTFNIEDYQIKRCFTAFYEISVMW